MALTVASCKDDDTTFNVTEDLDRLPMPMFRRKYNTNIADESDLYASRVMEGYRNRIQLHWYGIKGAAGYEIRYMVSVNARSNEEDWHGPHVTYVTLPADQLSYELKDLEYTTNYLFCIRALHPTDPAKNSKWYGMGDGRQWEDYLSIRTNDRYKVPFVVDTRDKEYDGFTVLINPTYNRAEYDEQDADTIESRFRIDGDKFKFTHLTVKAHSLNPTAQENPAFLDRELTPEELKPADDGFIHIKVDGLSRSALYAVALRDAGNTKAAAIVDSYYNYSTIRTKGDPDAPVRVPHKVATSIWEDPQAESIDMATEQKWFAAEQKYQACRIDTLIKNFGSDISFAENQVFLLEGGKAYYIRSNTNVNKGFTLKTDPADLEAGKGRAIVYLGGLVEGGNAANWNLSKEKEVGDFDAPIKMEKIIFEDIDFDCPNSVNVGVSQATGIGVTGNYFANMSAQGLPIEIESFEMHNCTFQGIRRGFFRIQGATKHVIKRVWLDNSVLFNCGYYSTGGIDYNLIHGQQENIEENICNDLRFTGNTFYDVQMGTIAPTKAAIGKGFADNVHWHITVENNTFINNCTRKDQALLNIKEVPGDSKITFKNNLICLARHADDKRRIAFSGIQVQNVYGSTNIEFDIRDNYSTGCLEDHLKDDGICTVAKFAFSANKNAPGFWPDCLGANTVDDLKVKVGEPALYTTDLFEDPNPRYHASGESEIDPDHHSIDPNEIWTRLLYKNDPKVLNHEIYTKNIGAQRWKTSDPKTYRVITETDSQLAATPAE